MKNQAVSSGGRGASMAKSDGYKMYHLMIVAIIGLLIGAYFQYMKNAPSVPVVVPPPTAAGVEEPVTGGAEQK